MELAAPPCAPRKHVTFVWCFLCCYVTACVVPGMACETSEGDVVSEYLDQNPQLAQWVDTFRTYCESNKQWAARREFLLRNMEAFPAMEPGVPSSSLDKLLSLSMVWANHVFLGCR